MQPALQLALLLAILLPAVKIAASSLRSVWNYRPILGELFVGVLSAQALFNLLHLQLFSGGEATGALMLLAQIGGDGVDVHCRHRDGHRANARGERHCIRCGAFGRDLAVSVGAGVGHLLGLSWMTACFWAGR